MSDAETSIYTRSSYREAVSTQHGALKYGSDLHVNERQEIRHYRGSVLKNKNKNKKECQMAILFTSGGAHVNCAMLYTHSIGNQL